MLGANWRDCIQTALTFDDVLMIPQHSDVDSRAKCQLVSRFSRNVPLKLPFISSPMDTVTETQMAIGMAQNGGLGIIHRFMDTAEQVEQVKRVKRYESFIKIKPYVVGANYTLGQVQELIEKLQVRTFLVTDDDIIEKEPILVHHKRSESPVRRNSEAELNYPLLGILTNRDMKFKTASTRVKDMMTPRDKLITLNHQEQNRGLAIQLMVDHKIEKLPVVQDNFIRGLVNLKDLERESVYTMQNKDKYGQLLVGAAVGATPEELDRAMELANAGCDVLVLDVANGHSSLAIRTVEKLKQDLPDIDIVAGSIATGEGAEALIKAGADGIRCGIGNGSICITRVVSGCGVPQFSALLDVAPICKKYEVPLISDGGNKNSGNMCKALAAGADCVMLGRLVAGCEESPSKEIYREGKILKVYRGMAGYGANVSKAIRTGANEPGSTTFTPEGVEGYIPFAGPVSLVLNQFAKGVQSGMSYNGAFSISELQKNVRFIRMTSSGFTESGVHGINKI